ncbi:MAG: hypothetical protein RLZZ546_1552 [Bacteroidota bacterium]|jgi:hypothetical protein
MKNLFNFLSSKETKTEKTNVSMNTQTNEIKTFSEEVVVKAEAKAPKKEWVGSIKVKYFYKTDELTKFFLDTVTQSLKSLSKTEGYYMTCDKKEFNEKSGKFYTIKNTNVIVDKGSYGISYTLKLMYLTEERIQKLIDSLSKNSKKRLNKKIAKLAAQLDNPNRLTKLLNYLEFLSTNQFSYEIGNTKENAISEKRKVYKDIVKHIKMNLVEELKKAKAEYREVKGDFYKKK